jgi:O-methyltransferase involved in polyketide biosynthesis
MGEGQQQQQQRQRRRQRGPEGDLTVTALYTSQVWRWGRLPGAELFDLPAARAVFRVTNAFLWVVRAFRWRLRSLKHSLLHRHTFIDALLRRSGARRVLELAAGLSRRGVSFSAAPDLAYTEVDLPPVVAAKRALLARSPAGTEAAARPNWRLAEGDVTALAPPELAALAPAGPDGLFVIAEGLLMYLAAPQQRALFERVRALLAESGGGTFVFDLVPAVEEPPPGLLGRALGWLMKRFTGGRSFERDQRTRADVVRELHAAGFETVAAVEPGAVATEYDLPHPRTKTQQLVFVAQTASEVPTWPAGSMARTS